MSTATVSPAAPVTSSIVTLKVTCRDVPAAIVPSDQVSWWFASGPDTVQVPAPMHFADPATYVVLPDVGRAGSYPGM